MCLSTVSSRYVVTASSHREMGLAMPAKSATEIHRAVIFSAHAPAVQLFAYADF
jgi:hypothetical protein